MVNRRKFLKGSFLGLLSTPTPLKWVAGSGRVLKTVVSSYPIVAATWDNRKATEEGMRVLLNGGSALDAVEAGARVPEGDPDDTSVGYGGYPDREGRVTLDACIMNEKGNAGSVTYLQHIKHPISVARRIMEKTPHVMLSGDGALQFALDEGFEREALLTEHAEKTWEEWLEKHGKDHPGNHDTIGILAIDEKGDISGACSTSGLAFKMPGRVGDSPIIGAGMYVDNEIGGACATGVGELVMKIVGSFMIVELMRQGNSPQVACQKAIERIVSKYPDVRNNDTQVGFLALNKQGEVGGYSVRPGYSIAVSEKKRTYLFDPDFFIK
jgi:N4-(beta-N-acetylglucosaminyl)-L-asparaginase